MNENLDLTKILDGCPKGTKLYSSIFGELSVVAIHNCYDKYPIKLLAYNKSTHSTVEVDYAEDGRSNYIFNGECTLFPSKDQRDWSKFERFWDKSKIGKFDPKTFQPFDKVLGFYEVEGGSWECALFSHLNETERSVICTGIIYDKCIPYNEETKYLVGTNDDCPEYYKWWEE